MAKIFSYRKVTDRYTTHSLVEPDYGDDDSKRIVELCTIDGLTYVAVPDGVTLPEQPEQIKKTLTEVTLDRTLREKIKRASPHIRLINQRVKEKIREKISLEEEIELLRRKLAGDSTVDSEFEAYHNYVETCRSWGRAEKVKLGV